MLLLLLACAPGTIDLVEVQRSEEVPTVVTARWQADPGAEHASVEFGPEGDLRWSAPAWRDGEDWVATLVGVKPDSGGTLVAIERVDAAERRSDAIDFETGSASSALPVPTLTIDEPGRWTDGFLVTTTVTSPAGVVILDADGDIVWWATPEGIEHAGRAWLSRDGRSVLTMDINAHAQVDNQVVRIGLDGAELERIEAPDAHHDFLELPDGSLAWLSHDSKVVDAEVVLGDSITLRSPDGRLETLWTLWSEAQLGMGGADPGGGPAGGINGISWTHCNAIDYEDGSFLVNSLGLSAIYGVDAATGEQEWVFGADQGDFVDSSGEDDILDLAHQFQLLDGSLLVFENGATSRGWSRVVEFSFDPDQPLADEIWSYEPDPEVYTFTLGNPVRLASGNTLANFSTSGQIDEVTPDGRLLWRLSAPLGGAFGYAEHVEAIGAVALD